MDPFHLPGRLTGCEAAYATKYRPPTTGGGQGAAGRGWGGRGTSPRARCRCTPKMSVKNFPDMPKFFYSRPFSQLTNWKFYFTPYLVHAPSPLAWTALTPRWHIHSLP